MFDNTQITVWTAFFAGLISFLSPCVLPLIPSYLAYLTGSSIQELTGQEFSKKEFTRIRQLVLLRALLFVLGFSLVFILFGMSASALGQLLLRHQTIFRQISGLLVIIFGLHMTGILKIGFLYREKRVNYAPHTASNFNAFLLGLAFSVGWTPCVGPILGSILLMAGSKSDMLQGGVLLGVYALGLAVPFLASAFFVGRFANKMNTWLKFVPLISVISGILMIIVGVMITLNLFARLSGYFFIRF